MNNGPKQPGRSSAVRAPGSLESPTLSFNLKSEIEGLHREEAWHGGDPDFRVVLALLKSNARLHKHKASGRISVRAAAGHIRMHVQDRVFDLPTGYLLALDRGVVHDVEAVGDSAFLLTIAWPEGKDKE